jgi:hemolysin III
MKRMVVTVRIKEPISALSHFVGILLAVAGLSILVTNAALDATARHVIGFAIFGTCMVLVYTASTLYHWLPLKVSQEKIFRRLDHSAIFMMIAGTYTPVGLVVLAGPVGQMMLALIWSLAIIGIIRLWRRPSRTSGQRGKLRWIDSGFYVLMGWIAVGFLYPMAQKLSVPALAWLVGGGVAYSVGALIYALKRPNPIPHIFGFHEIFHGFVLLGSFCHFWLMLIYVMPLTV